MKNTAAVLGGLLGNAREAHAQILMKAHSKIKFLLRIIRCVLGFGFLGVL